VIINRDYTVTLNGTRIPVVGWGVVGPDEARQFGTHEYGYAHEYAEATDAVMVPIVGIGGAT